MKFKEDIDDIEFPSCSMPDDATNLKKKLKTKNSKDKKKIILIATIIVLAIIIIIVLITCLKKKKDPIIEPISTNPITPSLIENSFEVTIFDAEQGKEIKLFNPSNIGLNDDDYIITKLYENQDNTRILEENYKNQFYPNKSGTFIFNIKFNKALKTIEGMFKDCIYLSKINLSGIKFGNISRMNLSFYNCTSLEDIIFGDFNSSQITNIDNAFEGCSNLPGLDLFSFKTNEIRSMNKAFKDCKTLYYLNLSNLIISNETERSDLFENAENLKIVIIDDDKSKDLIYDNKTFINHTNISCNNDSKNEWACHKCNTFKCETCFYNISYFIPNITFPIKCKKKKK